MRLSCVLVAALAASACTKSRTEVVLVVANDGLAIPGDINALRVTLRDATLSGAAATLYDSSLIPLCASPTDVCHTLPVDFTLTPGPDRPDDPVVVEVQALLGTTVVIDDTAQFTFLKAHSQRLDFDLFPACVGSDCSASQQTCGSDGKCTTIAPAPLVGSVDLAAAQPKDGGVDQGVADLAGDDLTGRDLAKGLDLGSVESCGDAGEVDVSSNADNCGSCGHVCTDPSPPFNTVPACVASTCAIGCAMGWGDCDHNLATNGCERDVTGDPSNCGACGHVCGARNVTGGMDNMGVCKNSACVFACAPGTAHCSKDDSLGCETTITGDNDNCGSCGFSCGSGTCSNGFCKLTAGGESPTSPWPQSALVSDATSLYWINYGPTPVVRKVNKDGTGLTTVFSVGAAGSGSVLAIDESYIYFFNDTYEHQFYRGVKVAGQTPALVAMLTNASASGILLNTDPTANATTAHLTQGALLAVNIDSGASPPAYTPASGYGAGGLARIGSIAYFGVSDGTHGSIQYFDMTATTPNVQQLASISGATQSIDAAGANVFAEWTDNKLYQIDTTSGTATTLATNGQATAQVITDGVNVYVRALNTIYKVPIGATTAAFSSFVLYTNAGFPNAPNFESFAVDGDALYFTTFGQTGDVWKTKK